MIARKLPIVSFCFLLVWLLSIALPAQTHQHSPKDHPPSAYKLVSIKVTGTKRYKPEDVIRATGLQLGQAVHKEGKTGFLPLKPVRTITKKKMSRMRGIAGEM